MYVNQAGQPIVEETLSQWLPDDLTDRECRKVLLMLIEHLGLEVVRTHVTEVGRDSFELRKVP